MKCEKCKKSEAAIHFTQIKNGKVVSYNLCKECAEKQGIKTAKKDSEHQQAFTPDAKSAVLNELIETKGSEKAKKCPFCHSNLDDIKRTGRVGCGQCYSAFDKQIDVLLRRIQGSSFHLGKRSVKPETQVYDDQVRMRELKKKLHDAVKLEDYELAAMLRDEIKGIEKRLEIS